jgi:hypothetical protein
MTYPRCRNEDARPDPDVCRGRQMHPRQLIPNFAYIHVLEPPATDRVQCNGEAVEQGPTRHMGRSAVHRQYWLWARHRYKDSRGGRRPRLVWARLFIKCRYRLVPFSVELRTD